MAPANPFSFFRANPSTWVGASLTARAETKGIKADVRSLILDERRAVMFIRADHEVPRSFALGETLKAHLKNHHDRTIDAVYWKFRAVPVAS